MYNLTKALECNVNELSKIIEDVEKGLEHMPNGWLQINTTKTGKVFFRQVESIEGKDKKSFVKKNDDTIPLLSSKCYFKKILPVLKRELKATEKFRKSYNFIEKYDVYRNLHPEKQKYVAPLFETVQAKVEAWKAVPYRPLEFMVDGQTFDTERGEKVRSKSEYMIANELHRRKDSLLYRYEQPLRLSSGTVYPDFEIISLKTGKIYYYEHFGKMDDAQYLEGFVKKMQRYRESNILLGQNLIATFESSGKPLHLSEIKAALEIID